MSKFVDQNRGFRNRDGLYGQSDPNSIRGGCAVLAGMIESHLRTRASLHLHSGYKAMANILM
ncbi:hypothetical protein Tsubulata_031320 [Turnera subulata]|uniref:Uncharacterized protein n=1 Tax=Turnera subulata TaxID=218843 RepID=A0A9Q0GHI8_9ROSI|nr:hypothetical protein Tsubulata_031320 [Turnera subulata]